MNGVERVALAALPAMILEGSTRHHAHSAVSRTVVLGQLFLEEGALMVPRVEPGVEFLQEPFTADALNRRVREVLDG
jgi:hypothetical protein